MQEGPLYSGFPRDVERALEVQDVLCVRDGERSIRRNQTSQEAIDLCQADDETDLQHRVQATQTHSGGGNHGAELYPERRG